MLEPADWVYKGPSSPLYVWHRSRAANLQVLVPPTCNSLRCCNAHGVGCVHQPTCRYPCRVLASCSLSVSRSSTGLASHSQRLRSTPDTRFRWSAGLRNSTICACYLESSG